jgi:hypothetical protein
MQVYFKKIMMLAVLFTGFEKVSASSSQEKKEYVPLFNPLHTINQGSTPEGTARMRSLAPLFLPFHAAACANYCSFPESKGVKAYGVLKEKLQPFDIVDKLMKAEAGGRCFLFCHRFDDDGKVMYHKKFMDTFLENFGPKDEALDARAIENLGAVLNMKELDYKNTVLAKYLRSSNLDGLDTKKDRLSVLIKGLKDYYCRVINYECQMKWVRENLNNWIKGTLYTDLKSDQLCESGRDLCKSELSY